MTDINIAQSLKVINIYNDIARKYGNLTIYCHISKSAPSKLFKISF